MSTIIEKFQHQVHEYERSKDNKEVYRCIHPKCNHYWNRQFLEGKEAICHKCKNVFILNWSQLRNKTPVCAFCSKSPKAKFLNEAREMALRALNDLPNEFKQQLLDQTLE